MEQRLSQNAKDAGDARKEAHKELKNGQKKGHWIWWVFPTLSDRGGDQFSRFQRQADLEDVATATAYAKHKVLRSQLLTSFTVATAAFAAATKAGGTQVPWKVLDSGFGRQANGAWLQGPVDSFKVYCSGTLFAAIAHKEGDAELRGAAVDLLSHFTGDVVYSPQGKGSSGHIDGQPDEPLPLKGHDAVTLSLVGGVTWDEIVAARGPPGAAKREL